MGGGRRRGGEEGEEVLDYGEWVSGGQAEGGVDGGRDGGEDLAEGKGAGVPVDHDDCVVCVIAAGGGEEVLGELVQNPTLGAVAVEANAEALGELKDPLGEGGGVLRQEGFDMFFVGVLTQVAEEREVFFVGEEVERGERVVGGFVGSRLVLVKVLFMGREVSGWCGRFLSSC